MKNIIKLIFILILFSISFVACLDEESTDTYKVYVYYTSTTQSGIKLEADFTTELNPNYLKTYYSLEEANGALMMETYFHEEASMPAKIMGYNTSGTGIKVSESYFTMESIIEKLILFDEISGTKKNETQFYETAGLKAYITYNTDGTINTAIYYGIDGLLTDEDGNSLAEGSTNLDEEAAVDIAGSLGLTDASGGTIDDVAELEEAVSNLTQEDLMNIIDNLGIPIDQLGIDLTSFTEANLN